MLASVSTEAGRNWAGCALRSGPPASVERSLACRETCRSRTSAHGPPREFHALTNSSRWADQARTRW